MFPVNADDADETKARAPREAMRTIIMTENTESFMDLLLQSNNAVVHLDWDFHSDRLAVGLADV